MHPREVSTFFGVLGGKSGLETLFAVLNDGALGQLNYFRGERENVVMENEEANEWPGEERVKVGGPSQLDPFSQLLFVLYTALVSLCITVRTTLVLVQLLQRVTSSRGCCC